VLAARSDPLAIYWAVRIGDRRQVARLLAQGRFAHAFVNRQDLAAIYRKLPANRRRDAVLRARELELI
jgi:ATP/maltotriose-dependent transcriptional regulator MalT